MSEGANVLALLGVASRLCLATVFALSAALKLRAPRQFASNVIDYRILPAGLAYAFALTLIPIEGLVALSLFSGLLVEVAMPIAAGLLATFFVAVWVNIRRGRTIPCGCFGARSEPISARTLVRLLMLLVAVLVASAFPGPTSDPSVIGSVRTEPARVQYFIEAAGVACGLMLLGLWILRAPELARLANDFRRGTRGFDEGVGS